MLAILEKEEQIAYIQYGREAISTLTERRRRANIRGGGCASDVIVCAPANV